MDELEAPLEHSGGGGAHRIGRGLGPDYSQGRSEQLAPVRPVSHTVSIEQSESLTGFEAVAL